MGFLSLHVFEENVRPRRRSHQAIHALMGCEAVTDVEFRKLEVVGESAFNGCTSLSTFDLSSVRIVEREAFLNCTSMEIAEFGKCMETFGCAAFGNCTSLERITIPLKKGLISHDDTFIGCTNLKHVDLVEGEALNQMIDALLLDEWRNDMKDEIDSINQTLASAAAGVAHTSYFYDDVGEKARAIREWVARVLYKIVDYKAQHRNVLNLADSVLAHALPKDVMMNNVLPFLELPQYSFEGERKERK